MFEQISNLIRATSLIIMFSYILAFNPKYKFSFNNILWEQTGENEHTFHLNLDLSAFLNQQGNDIDLKNEFLTHTNSGQQALTEKVVSNFLNALTVP